MDYSLLFAVERNVNFKNIKVPSRATTITTNSEEDEETHQRGKTYWRLIYLYCIALKNFDKTRHTFLSHSGRYIYHIAIIDYLQDYNIEKKLENRLKMFINKEGA